MHLHPRRSRSQFDGRSIVSEVSSHRTSRNLETDRFPAGSGERAEGQSDVLTLGVILCSLETQKAGNPHGDGHPLARNFAMIAVMSSCCS